MGTTHDCNFKNGCSMLNPTLLLEISLNNFPAYTAFKIDNRYYKVTDIRSVRNNLFEVTGEIDVLATYKADILASTQFVSYSSHKTSVWLPDTRIPVLKNATVAQKITTMNFLFNETGFYVFTAIGENGCKTYGLAIEEIRALLASISSWQNNGINNATALIQQWRGIDVDGVAFSMADDDISTLGECISNSIKALADAIGATMANTQKALADSVNTMGKAAVETGFIGNAYSDAPSCIRSCIWVPFFASFFTTGAAGQTIHLGAFDTGVPARECKATPESRTVTVDIPWQYSDWRRSVCEEVYLYLPLVGMVSIPSDEIINESQIEVTWSATATDGCIAYLVKAGNQVIGTYGANASANYPIGVSQQASAGEIVQSILAGSEKTIASGVETAKNFNKGNVLGGTAAAAQTTFNAISGLYDNINTKFTRHNSCIGGIGGGAGCGLSLDLKCFTVAHPTVISPDNMETTMGLPTMQPMSLANLTGYCQCANAHVDAAATETELGLLDTYLNSGFFIE